MPLSAAELARRLWDGTADVDRRNHLGVVPLVDAEHLRKKHTASLDLRLGRWFRTMRQTKLTSLKAGDERVEEAISREHYVKFNDYFVLHPGQFVLGVTLEWLNLPIDLSGYVVGKSSWGRRGLIIETAAGIHPGFTGCLTLELANVGSTPIELTPGMQVCQIFFHNVAGDKGSAVTQFVGFRKPGLGRVERDATLDALGKSYFPD
jgi:dCTP deaminase